MFRFKMRKLIGSSICNRKLVVCKQNRGRHSKINRRSMISCLPIWGSRWMWTRASWVMRFTIWRRPCGSRNLKLMNLSGYLKILRRRIRLRVKPLALKCSSKWVLCIKIISKRSVVLQSRLVAFRMKSKLRSTDGKIRTLHFKTRPTI